MGGYYSYYWDYWKGESRKGTNDATDGGSPSDVAEPEIRPVNLEGVRCSNDWTEPECIVSLEDINIEENSPCKEIAAYCLPLLQTKFCGQTTTDGHTDQSCTKDLLNLGLYISLLDKFLRQFEKVTDFTGTEEEYLHILRLIAIKRRRDGENVEECYKRLLNDNKRFVKIYHKRGVQSYVLTHGEYWGSRQQLLAGKVVGDWVDKENGPLDPLFGVLLQPSAGRVGSGDSGWFHNALFDDDGYMAYHSAVHDSFGYLLTVHQTGPGYDYMNDSWYWGTDNPMAGQLSGIGFWQSVLNDVKIKQKVIRYMSV